MFGFRSIRFLLGIGVAFVLLIIAIIIIVNHKPAGLPKGQAPLTSYVNDPTAQASLLIDGPVNSVADHRQVQILVTNSQTTINIFSGYSGQVLNSHNYPNNTDSFNVFLRSLMGAGYQKGNNDPALAQAAGYCPLGNRYIFSFDDNGRQLTRYWNTDCGGIHTYDGNQYLTVQLFQNQVPNYLDLTNNLGI